MAYAKLSGSLLGARKDAVPADHAGTTRADPLRNVADNETERDTADEQSEARGQPKPAHHRTPLGSELISGEGSGPTANNRQFEHLGEVDSSARPVPSIGEPTASRLEGVSPPSDRAAVAATRPRLASAAREGIRWLSLLLIGFVLAIGGFAATTAIGSFLFMRKRISATATAIVLVPTIFGGSIGAWSTVGPSIVLPTWLGGSVPEVSCGTIVNRNGQTVPRRCRAGIEAPDARGIPTALCRDGEYSWSQQPYAAETCADHGGVAAFL